MARFGANSRRQLATALGLLVIAALFVFQLAAIAEHRVDYPLIDDWRYYHPFTRLPGELTLEWLFEPAEDTLHVSGKLLTG